MDVFSGILMISMNDRVCAGFAQCDLNVALALRNAAALPDQEHSGTQPHFLIKSMNLSTKGEIAVTSLGKERSSSMQGRP